MPEPILIWFMVPQIRHNARLLPGQPAGDLQPWSQDGIGADHPPIRGQQKPNHFKRLVSCLAARHKEMPI
ncbi:hypothetical protein E4L95_02570 [Paracoccus liaowanqingii]|uniref:Uncharacterized protein n=1 Tax=Paracoccus liaowanqingii TaxID=2560053 RepID=A0A4Z1CS61_9RHOB|nr:hypothetical protein E4L95_02570 [Paracoccus liaowanqingii]